MRAASEDARPSATFSAEAVAALVTRGAALAAALLFQLAFARLLSPESYGRFVFALTFFAGLAPFAALGADQAAVRFLPSYRATQRLGSLRGYLGWANRRALAVAGAVAAAAMLGTLAFSGPLETELVLALLLGWAALPFAAVGSVATMALRALRRVVWGQLPFDLLRPALAVALAVAALGRFAAPPAALGMAAYLVATVTAQMLARVALYRHLPQGTQAAPRERHVAEWSAVGLHLLLLHGLWGAMTRLDVLMLGMIRGTLETASYAPATYLAALVLVGTNTLYMIAGPRINEAHAGGRAGELRATTRRTTLGSAALALPVAIGLALAGKPLLSWFHPDYAVAYPALLILCAGHLANAATGPVDLLLVMTGAHRKATVSIVLGAVANVLLNALLIPPFGLPGAAAATAISTVFWKLIAAGWVRQHLGLSVSLPAALLRR